MDPLIICNETDFTAEYGMVLLLRAGRIGGEKQWL
jgi:hypothetical protein